MNERVIIRAVDWTDQREQLLAVRFSVFVDEQGVPAEMEEDEYDSQALHLLATAPSGEPVACARMIHSNNLGHIGRMAVLPEYRRLGLGTRLLRRLLQLADRQGLAQVQLHAQCNAEGFYRKQGFLSFGEVFEEAGIPHRKMIRPHPGKTAQ